MTDIARVKPGDLITADFINGLIDIISDLQARVGDLENGLGQSQNVQITAFDPPPPPQGAGQALGQVMRIYGVNFAFPSANNTVKLQNFGVPSGGLAVVQTFRPGSSPTQLEFVIPTNIAGIAAGGTDVTITVSNSNGSAHTTYRLKPALPQNSPPPNIDTIKDAFGSFILQIEKEVVITGQNFGPTAAENQITFICPLLAGGEARYPDPSDPLRNKAIDFISVSSTQIKLIVPKILEANINGIDVSLELKVGNHPSIEKIVNVTT